MANIDFVSFQDTIPENQRYALLASKALEFDLLQLEINFLYPQIVPPAEKCSFIAWHLFTT